MLLWGLLFGLVVWLVAVLLFLGLLYAAGTDRRRSAHV